MSFRQAGVATPADGLTAVVVGAGLMGRWHARELQRAGGRLVGVCDSNVALAERLSSAHGGIHANDDLEDVLAQTAPQVVHVCTPTESHVSIVEQALEAGAHALVEKPLAPDTAATQRLLQRATREGLLVVPVHQYLFQPGVARAEEALRSRGPLLGVDSVACSAGGDLAAPDRLDRIAADILPHPLAVLQRLLPGGVGTLCWSAASPRAGELRATAETNTAVVSVHVSMTGRPTRNEMRLIAEGGTIHLDFFHGYGFVERATTSRAHKVIHPFARSARRGTAAATNLARRAVRREPAYPGLRELIGRFYAAASGGDPPPIPPADVLSVARARDQVIEQLRRPGAVGSARRDAASA